MLTCISLLCVCLLTDKDEFCIPEGSENTDWHKALDFRLRLNRAGYGETIARTEFVESLNSVSDHLGCIFYILRNLSHHVGRHGDEMTKSTALRPIAEAC